MTASRNIGAVFLVTLHMYLLPSLACHLRCRHELHVLARGGLTAPGKYPAHKNLSDNYTSSLQYHLLSDWGRRIWYLCFQSLLHQEILSSQATLAWRYRHLREELVSFHFYLSLEVASSSLYNWLCLCFLFQGKTMPPTGQRPAKSMMQYRKSNRSFWGFKRFYPKPKISQNKITPWTHSSTLPHPLGRCDRMGPAKLDRGITTGVRMGRRVEIWGCSRNAMLSPSDIGLCTRVFKILSP